MCIYIYIYIYIIYVHLHIPRQHMLASEQDYLASKLLTACRRLINDNLAAEPLHHSSTNIYQCSSSCNADRTSLYIICVHVHVYFYIPAYSKHTNMSE